MNDERWALISLGYSAHMAVPLDKLSEILKEARVLKSEYVNQKTIYTAADDSIDIKVIPKSVIITSDVRDRMLSEE